VEVTGIELFLFQQVFLTKAPFVITRHSLALQRVLCFCSWTHLIPN